MRQTRAFLVPVVAFVTLPSLAFAATIRGTVTDPSRAVVAGAKVTVKSEGTGVARSAATNSAGIFSVTDLAVGRYEVQVAFPGFRPVAIRGIALDVADARALDVALEIGDVREHVAVDAS